MVCVFKKVPPFWMIGIQMWSEKCFQGQSWGIIELTSFSLLPIESKVLCLKTGF